MLKFTNQVLTKYSDNIYNINSVIDLIFLRLNSLEFDNHTIHSELHSELHYLSNYALLIVDISIIKEFIPNKQYTIIKNSEEENKFITDLIKTIKKIGTEQISNKNLLELAVQEFANKSDVI